MDEKESKRAAFAYKQAIVIRKDLKMSKGKAIAQGAHVAVLAAMAVYKKNPGDYDRWRKEGHAKIALVVESLEELDALKRKAEASGIACEEVVDFGLTELEPGTKTAIAIGPDLVEKVDAITKNLKLA